MCSFFIHNDADGIVSGLIFKEYNPEKEFKGFYNLRSFFLNKKIDLKEDIAVDLDMNICRSIGHHMNPFNNNLSINPNKKFKSLYDSFYHKCPLNTVMLLLNKYNIKITTDRQVAIVMFCDGVFTYYDKYRKNCDTWLSEYSLSYLADIFNSRREKIEGIINNEIVPIFSDTGKYNSLKVNVKDGELQKKEIIEKFSQYIIDNFNLSIKANMFDIQYLIQKDLVVKQYTFYNEEQYENIRRRMEEVQGKETILVSSAMVFRNKINITMTKDCYIN